MKRLLLLCFMFITTIGYAQDPFLQKPNRKLDAKAKELTFKYNKHLALDSDQFPLFAIKVEEFLIRDEDIRKQFKGKEKLDMLYILQQRETLEMHDILTREQLAEYKRVKPDLQPLDVVDLKKLKRDAVSSIQN